MSFFLAHSFGGAFCSIEGFIVRSAARCSSRWTRRGRGGWTRRDVSHPVVVPSVRFPNDKLVVEAPISGVRRRGCAAVRAGRVEVQLDERERGRAHLVQGRRAEYGPPGGGLLRGGVESLPVCTVVRPSVAVASELQLLFTKIAKIWQNCFGVKVGPRTFLARFPDDSSLY